MIRPFTCVCMLLAGGSGLYLYQSKHRAQLLDREIGRVLKQTEVARDRIGVLRAEWAVLNEPERLAELSRQHLGLRQLSPTQFVAVADLGARLPSAVAPGTVFTPAEEPVVTASVAPAPAPPPPAPRSAPAPAPRAATPAPVPAPAAVARAPAAPPRPAPRLLPEAPVQLAAPMPAPLPVRPVAPMMNVAASPMTPIVPAPRPTLPPGSIGESVLRASVLGGARAALPPPTPYGSP